MKVGHVHKKRLRRSPIFAPVALLPLQGATNRQAQEYTCDRYGLACGDTPEDAVAGMAALAAGQARWPELNFKRLQERRMGLRGFWASDHEYLSDYLWVAKGAYPLYDLASGREPREAGRNSSSRCLRVSCREFKAPGWLSW